LNTGATSPPSHIQVPDPPCRIEREGDVVYLVPSIVHGTDGGEARPLLDSRSNLTQILNNLTAP